MSALDRFLAELAAGGDTADAALPHSVVVTDPDTDTVYVYGPYPSRYDAGLALLTLKGRYEAEDMPDLQLQVALHCKDGSA